MNLSKFIDIKYFTGFIWWFVFILYFVTKKRVIYVYPNHPIQTNYYQG